MLEYKVIEYMELTKIPDRVGHKWTTKMIGKSFTGYMDMPLLKVLNILGNDGWELCASSVNHHVMKRVVE